MGAIGIILAGAVLATAPALRSVELKPGDRVAMLGDSITAQKSYTRYLETYLELCSGVKDLSFMQFGWPGGTAPHAIERMSDDVLGYRPTVTTVMFGINDGKHKPYSDAIALPYKTNLVTIARMLRAAGSKALFLSPSTMDPTYKDDAAFIDALDKMSDRCREAAEEEGASFADVNALHESVQNRMIADLGKAKCKFSPDGCHDYPIGHFIMLAGALDGFKLDGRIAELTLDAKTGRATASEGHKVVSSEAGKATFESTRYPFCFPPNPKTFGEDIAAALPYLDFQEKHNRFILKVKDVACISRKCTHEGGETGTCISRKCTHETGGRSSVNCADGKVNVIWSDSNGRSFTNAFSCAELEKGVNLADAFRDNPFVVPFYAYFDKALDKEYFEVDYTCTVVPFWKWTKEATGKDLKEKFRPLWADLLKEQARRMAELKKLHVPITHTITVEPVK